MSNNNPTVLEQLRGFPVFQMIIIMLLRLSEPIAFSSFLSYIFFMIKSFRITKNDAEVSRYSGYLASAFSLSQFFSSVPWGIASDKFGRKPSILFGCMGTAFSMILFGFSKNFTLAFISRILMGLLNGNVPIMRTTVGEIAVEKRHQGIAFSNLSLIWGLGKCIGAYLAGHLTDVDHFREYKRDEQPQEDSIFIKFPFAYTNIVIALLILNFCIIGWLFLEETHDELKNKRDRGLEIGDKIRKLLGFEVPDRPWQMKKGESFETLIDENSIDYEDSEYEMQSISSNEYVPIKIEEEPNIFTWPIIHRISCNFFISFSNIIYTEFFPIFLAKTIRPESLKIPFHMKGGFGYSTDSTGKLLSITGLIGVIAVSLLFPIINKYFTILTAFRIGLMIIPILFFVIPLNLFTIPEYTHSYSHTLTTTLLYLNAGFLSFFGSINNSQMVLLIHRASPRKQRALINGYTISITALSRFIAPLIWGWVMSKFDLSGTGGLSWWLLAGEGLFVFGLSFILNEDDEQD
ncbi:uncharacterized protein KGF55_004786 [Candida pseudojiufengensis]|uniref:uncharacterized protein n=1 Tax=Candida pseudojiufengensis TaxID=497109 RepID=UPI002225920E|nr:uncharacterized protein KGF55_004786 [Candida pseudojiufengensis]KAI5960063.1 hypothetical protein KGF55_004786 [Candida pseudojiufengensis]